MRDFCYFIAVIWRLLNDLNLVFVITFQFYLSVDVALMDHSNNGVIKSYFTSQIFFQFLFGCKVVPKVWDNVMSTTHPSFGISKGTFMQFLMIYQSSVHCCMLRQNNVTICDLLWWHWESTCCSFPLFSHLFIYEKFMKYQFYGYRGAPVEETISVESLNLTSCWY